ncbi:ferritin [Candidatus Woesearchaeota archaeon]|nr:ferritin [Candidatus Woesearchaeota archaeon]
MVLSKKVHEALNKQINKEFQSAYIYLAMAAYFDSIYLRGFRHWMEAQAKEEVHHGMKIYEHILERDSTVVLQPIQAPALAWKSPLDAVTAAYKHEQEVTKSIHQIVDVAQAEHDHTTEVFLQWFVNEQVEEEDATLELLKRVTLAGNEGAGLLLLDAELAKRE